MSVRDYAKDKEARKSTVGWDIKVDHHVDIRDIQTSTGYIGCDQDTVCINIK
jgi:hypothetical protein